MADIALSLVIVALTGAVILLIFIMVGRRRKAADKEVDTYCRERGYACSRSSFALGKELIIRGEGFTLKSKMVSHRQEETTGSSAWEKETIWETRGPGGPWPDFILGSVSASPDWQSMPDLIRNTATQRLNRQTGSTYASSQGRIICRNKSIAFLLFENSPEASGVTTDKILPRLDAWQETGPLVIYSGAQGISIRLANHFIRDAAQLDRVISLGQACAQLKAPDMPSS